MKTYCITPVHNPNIDYLKQNIESIRSQTKEVKHMLVFDGQGLDQRKIRDRVDLSEIEIMQLPESHGDYGDIPRFLGSVSAFRRGAEAVFWLDDDNWVESNHVEKMISNLSEKRPIATCQRNICTLEGNIMGQCFETNPNQFIDTNCFMIHRHVKALCNIWWMLPDDQHIFGDKIMYKHILDQKIRTTHFEVPTVNYRTNFNFHYQYYGYPIPKGTKDGVGVQYANQKKKNVNIDQHLNTHNWFDFQDFYTFISEKKELKSFVEVGVWKGHSICFLAKLLKERDVSIYAVDLWENTYQFVNQSTSIGHDIPHIYDIYMRNLELNGVKDKITKNIKKISWEAANEFEDGTLDFVYIDADHEYDSVVKDINAWLPKVRKGGIIAGHDYFSPCGVKQAVDEKFKEKTKFYNKAWYVNL